MHTLNHVMERTLIDADGVYLNDQDLRLVEQYLHSYSDRLRTYQILQTASTALVKEALRQFFQVQPELVQKHGERCLYDMSEVVRYIAVSILRDDETLFKEQMLAWLDTVLMAHKHHQRCAIAYRYLQDVINAKLPQNNSSIIRPYLDSVIMALQAHA